jgi:hypothetical protein
MLLFVRRGWELRGRTELEPDVQSPYHSVYALTIVTVPSVPLAPAERGKGGLCPSVIIRHSHGFDFLESVLRQYLLAVTIRQLMGLVTLRCLCIVVLLF